MKLSNQILFKSFDQDLQIAYGEVYVPGVPDSHGHFMREETVQKMAHFAMESGNITKIDVMHQNVLVAAHPIESFIARKNDPDFIPGSWVVGLHIHALDVWEKIKKSELAGFSIEIQAKLQEVEIEIEVPDQLEGKTWEQEGHLHKYTVQLDNIGRVIKGFTDEVNGHSHEILASSSTELTQKHRHRFNYLDELVALAA